MSRANPIRPQNSNNSSPYDGNDTFMRQFAAEIAQALRDQDEAPRPAGNVEETVPTLYRALCFDEPMIDDIINISTTASALCRKLTSATDAPYALSDRLVNGIVYLCQRQRTTATATTSSSPSPSPSTSSEEPTALTTVLEMPAATSLALARLAFCVLIQIPLECCQAHNHSVVQSLLGSYKGTLTSSSVPMETLNDTTDERIAAAAAQEAQTDRKVEQLAEALAGASSAISPDATDHSNNDDNTSSSPHEIWAAESDPSDYEYGEEDIYRTMPREADFCQQDDILDALVLSTADSELTRQQAQTALGSLLQQANYTLFVPLFASSLSKRTDVELYISELTQLLLILLQPSPCPLLQLSPSYTTDESPLLQDALLAPLWTIRDAALHHSTPQHTLQSFFTASYMEVLQTLLAVDQAHQQDTTIGSGNKGQPLCSASIVGFSALSSWCSTAQISVALTTTAILDSMNDLAHVMERAAESGYQDNLRHSVIPMVEVFTGITYQDRKSNYNTATSSSSTVAQTLLNSGWLRQLLVLSLDGNDRDRTGQDPPQVSQSHLDHALWGLCVAYPKVIGKYVSRYPGVPTMIRRYNPASQHEQADDLTTTSRHCVQAILWNCFGYSHCADDAASQRPRVVWKTNSASSAPPPPPPLMKDECQEVCQKAWIRLCQVVEAAVKDSSTLPKDSLQVLRDWERLLVLVCVPSMALIFQTLVVDAMNNASQLQVIQTALQSMAQTTNQNNQEDIRTKDEKLADDDEDDRKKSSMSNRELVVATTRKLLKQYTLYFQGNTRGSSKTD